MTTVFPRFRRQILSSLLVLFSGSLAFAQSSLSLASGSTVQGGSVSLNLGFSAGTNAPSGAQWTLSYSPTDIVSMSLAAGPALTAVGKTLNCASSAGSVTCLASGSNTSTIGSGVLAVVTATVSSSSTATLDTLAMSNAVAAAPDGSFDAITATGGSIAVGATVSALQCQPATLASGASSTCTVTVSAAAPSGGLTVALSGNNAALTVPASVAVATGSTTGTFSATGGTVSANQSATLTASLNGTSATSAITVTPQIKVNTLQCSPSTISSGGTSTCTITLSQAAPTGGSSVALSSSNSALTVPASATVAAGSTTGTFSATGGTVSANQSATLTASLNGGSATASVTVGPQVTISSLQCSPSTITSGGTSTCTVTLSQAAPTGGSSVALSSSNSALTVPASATVAAGSTTGTFSATAGTVTAKQSATVTASLNGSSATASVTVGPQVTVSSLQCSPSTITSGGTATCTVTLSQVAPAGGSSVALSSSNAAVTVPASATVAAGSTTATFTATAGTVTANQSATVTASLNGSATASVAVSPQVTVSSLQCSPSTITSGGTATCTVTLSQAAPAGGSSVSVSSNNTAVTVPSSVMVAAAATTANFTATSSSSGATGAAGTLSQTATLAATLNGNSATTNLTVTAQVTVSALSCTPSTVISKGSSTCTVTLSQSAPTGGLSVALSANNAALTVPSSVTVAAGSKSATLAATAGSLTSQQTATITATLNGNSVSAQLTLQPTAAISFVQAKAKAANSSAKTLSVAFGSQTHPGDIILVGVDFVNTTFSSITDSLGNTFTEVGSQITTPGAQIHCRFYYAVNITGGTDTVTIKLAGATTDLEVYLAEYAGVSQTNPIDAHAAAVGSGSTVSSGNAATTAAGDLIFGYCVADSSCTAGSGFTARSTFHSNLLEDTIAGNAGSYAATGSSDSTWAMQMVALKPAIGAAPAITMAPASILASTHNGSSHVAAGGTTQQAASVSAPQIVSGISCTPKLINAGGHATCELRVAGGTASVPVNITSSSSHVQVPAVVTTRPNQASLSFTVSADALSPQQSVTLTAAASDDTAAQDTIQLQAATHPVVTAPKKKIGRPGEPVEFTVTAADASGQPMTIAASAVPPGASFDPAAGRFQWTPGNNQIGAYNVGFTAAGASDESASVHVSIDISSGEPALDAIERSCSPGAVGAVTGHSLAGSNVALSDWSGNILDLQGTKVKVNGQFVPVLVASAENVQFLCPAVDPGTRLALVVETPSGATNTVNTIMQGAAPWIFPAASSQQNQGMISFDGTAELAMVRNAYIPAHPAQPGDEVLIWATGLGSPANVSPTAVSVTLGGWNTEVDSINPVGGSAGVFTISVRVPASITPGGAVPVQINVSGPGGTLVSSNTVTMTVEQVRQ